MASLNDPEVKDLLENPNYAVISTINPNGLIHNAIAWIAAEDGTVTVNSARGRLWPNNLERDPRVTVLVYESDNPYHYVEIRGTAQASERGADEHIDKLAMKYINQDEYPFRRAGEQRVKFVISPAHVRYVKQGSAGARYGPSPRPPPSADRRSLRRARSSDRSARRSRRARSASTSSSCGAGPYSRQPFLTNGISATSATQIGQN